MGNLRDQLKKAKVLSKKDAKRLAHEERVKRKEVGREALEQEDLERKEELAKLQSADRERDRERQAELDRERKAGEERAACAEILRSRVEPPPRGGRIRWFFETPSGALPWLLLNHAELAQLNGGNLCVVRRGAPHTHVYGLLSTELARRVHALFPDRVVWSAPGSIG